jgi:hypothetical protein
MSHQPQFHELKLGAAKPVLGIGSELHRRRRQSVQGGIGVDHRVGERVSAWACQSPGEIRAGVAYRRHRSW